jgi:hypothetical protein
MSKTAEMPWLEDEQRERDTVRDVMATHAGRRLLLGLITPALLSQSYVPGDPMAAAFNEGRRSVALELMARLDSIAPDLLLAGRREEIEECQRLLIARNKMETEQERTAHV